MKAVEQDGVPTDPVSVRRRSRGLQDEVYTEIRRRIVGGLLPPGERLRELAMAQEFGTSQAPVREALRRLSQEGLVHSVPRSGSFVAEPSMSEIEDVYVLRAEVESLAVGYFVSRASDEAIGELYRCLEDMRVANEANDYAAGSDADMRFHRAICRGSGSVLFEDVWAMIDSRVRGIQALVAPRSAFAKQLVDKHEPVLRALVRRDGHAAESLIKSHVGHAWTEIREILTPYGAASSDSSRPRQRRP